MPVGTEHLRDSGKTVIDVLVACAALTLLGCVVLPALSKERDDARIAQCADHQKQLGQAAHQYAADFEGKFFYNRSRTSDHKKQHRPEIAGMWYDPERVGRYLDGKLMYYPWYGPRAQALKKKPPEEPPADWPHAGLGGGVFVCPSDAEKSGRSYDMNYWAATGHVLHPDEKIPWPYGELFDSNAAQLDKLMLFTDVIAIQKTARGWVTNVRLGAAQLPGQRFGGVGYAFWNDQSGRFYDNQVAYRTLLDYVRHGENQDRLLPEGAVNIGYADSHVELKRHDHLYDVDSKFSTYDTLWSPVDWLVEKGKGYAQRREISNDVQSIP